MKLVLLISLVFSASVINTYATDVSEILQLTKKVDQYVTECINDTGHNNFETGNDVIKAMISGEDKYNNVEKITHCFFRKTGILNSDGNLNVDAASSILALIGMSEAEVEQVVKKCSSIAGFDAKDTAYAIFKCFEDGFQAEQTT